MQSAISVYLFFQGPNSRRSSGGSCYIESSGMMRKAIRKGMVCKCLTLYDLYNCAHGFTLSLMTILLITMAIFYYRWWIWWRNQKARCLLFGMGGKCEATFIYSCSLDNGFCWICKCNLNENSKYLIELFGNETLSRMSYFVVNLQLSVLYIKCRFPATGSGETEGIWRDEVQDVSYRELCQGTDEEIGGRTLLGPRLQHRCPGQYWRGPLITTNSFLFMF